MKHRLWNLVWMVALTACWPLGVPHAGAQQHTPAHVKDGSADITNDVGSETCALCHAPISNKFGDNPHSKLALMHGGQGVTCESCHGPGKAHVESGGDPTKILQISKMKPNEVDATLPELPCVGAPQF